jgi:PAS domain S-box-containing protein
MQKGLQDRKQVKGAKKGHLPNESVRSPSGLRSTLQTVSGGKSSAVDKPLDENNQTPVEIDLGRSEEIYRSLIRDVLDSSAIGMIILDADQRAVWMNRTFELYFGVKREELLGKQYKQFICGRAADIFDDPQTISEKFSATYEDPACVGDFQCRIRPHGKRAGRWLEHRSQPVRTGFYAGGRIEQYTDISQHKRAEEISLKLGIQLQHAQKMESIGTLAGGIAHDFNNILQAISGYVQLLLIEKEVDHPDFEMLDEVEKASRKAGALTQQLLAFSRRVESALKPTNLNEKVVHVKEILHRTIPKMIAIQLELDPELKMVNADEGQIEQVLMNLGINAKHAMPDGGRLIFKTENVYLDREFCETQVDLTPGQYVRLSVTDTGAGMNQQTQKNIFDPFFTTRQVGQGSGLGLSMAYGIVKNHNGHISFSSEPGCGTEFEIYLPVLQTQDEIASAEPCGCDPACGGDETILVVDDDDAVLNLGQNILERFGYSALKVKSGEAAVHLYEQQKEDIDLVILDLNMPGMGGQNCLAELIRFDPEIKVIVASGYPPDDAIKKILEPVVGGYIAKPYRLTDMMQKVRELLDCS